MSDTARSRTMRGLWRGFAGAIVGAALTGMFLSFLGPSLDLHDPEVMLAVVAGFVYGLIGLSVTFGILAPRTGAHFLNVEDAEELREESRSLRKGAAICVLSGAFFLIMALAGHGPLANNSIALMLAGLCILAVVVLGLTSKPGDEMRHQIGLQASAATIQIALVALAVWAALIRLGYAGWIGPLGLVACLALLNMVAIFTISARKGLMVR